MSLRTSLSWICFPLTMWYGVGVSVRNLLYNMGILRQEAPHITTIGVGNLSTGGTGKTPHVEYLLRLLADRYPTAMVSRGYRRSSKGLQVDDGEHSPSLLGDEPAMLAAKFPQVRVAVCADRGEAIRRLQQEEQPPQLVVLDDVFQHRRLKPSVNILLTDYRHPFFRDRILPFGNLREFKSARYRASIVIVTKTPCNLNPVERHNIVADLRLQNYQKVFFSYFDYGTPYRLDGSHDTVDLRRVDHVLAVTGIAHPEPLVDELRRLTKVQHMPFADHHAFTARDVAEIRKTFDAIPGDRKVILTTEKDAVRLRPLAEGLPVYVQPVEVRFHPSSEADFDTLIESTVKENISFLNKLNIWDRPL